MNRPQYDFRKRQRFPARATVATFRRRCVCVAWMSCLVVGFGMVMMAQDGAAKSPGARAAAAADGNTEAHETESMPVVRFESDPSAVFDPFFPESKYHKPPEPGPDGDGTVDPVDPYRHLEVRGLISGARRRLATINNYTFAVGEVIPVRIPGWDGQKEEVIEVKCLEIRRNSVVVIIKGQTESRELLLKSVF